MATGKKQEVATTAKKSGALVPTDLAQAIAADKGTGFEETKGDAFSIPFLRILQDLSPQVKKTRPEYIKGAAPGDIFNTVTKALAKEVRVIPCYFIETYIEWVPRNKGGGLVAVHPSNTPLVRQARQAEDSRKQILPNGNELVRTHSHFVIVLNEDDSMEGALIPMSSTMLKFSKDWNASAISPLRTKDGAVVSAHPKRYQQVFTLKTKEVSNDQGTWYIWEGVDREPVMRLEEFQTAQAFYESMRVNQSRVDYSELQDSGVAGGGRGGTPSDLDDNELDA